MRIISAWLAVTLGLLACASQEFQNPLPSPLPQGEVAQDPLPSPLPQGEGVQDPLPSPLPQGEVAQDPLPSPLPQGEVAQDPLPSPLPQGEGVQDPLPSPLPQGEGVQDPLPSPLPQGEGVQDPLPQSDGAASPAPLLPSSPAPQLPSSPALPCPLFPPDNIWNTPIDTLPRHPLSDEYVDAIGRDAEFHADFGSGIWPPDDGGPIGIPYVVVPANQPGVPVSFYYDDQSDPGPYPVPPDPPIEGGPQSDGDRHILILQEGTCRLYELYDAWPRDDGGWDAGSGAIYDLNSHALRPAGWTSADAAGLPILPGLVRYDEVLAGEITHALRFTAPDTQQAFVWPARHFASDLTETRYPPMGQRFRLRADFDLSGFAPEVQVILRAMQHYGIILADNGSPWYVSGAPDERWDNDVLHQLDQLTGDDFEAVDVSSLMRDPDSGQVVARDEATFLPAVVAGR